MAAVSNAAGGRYLAKEDIILYGMQLTAAPVKQTVPKNMATIVSTYLQVPTMPEGQIPPLAPDAVVKATLRGPGLEQPIELAVAANSPFNIPPLTVPGTYSLDGIRLEAGGEVLFYGTPESVKIEIIEKLLVTQVTARPLTADEIRERGIVFDKSNFQAYNFTAAFAVAPGKEISINMPVILPKLETTQDVQVDGITIPGIQGAQIQTLSTIIPDALKLAQTTIPNLSVQSFTLKVDENQQNNFYLPPIPGVVVIPGDIGFLNQYFSVMLMVGNAAPADSGLVVKDLRAEIIFPGGKDEVVGTTDDPLVMANTERGQAPRLQPVAKPGPDGKLGTGDDSNELAPGETGNADFLVEGRREGSHTVEMEISGMLHGLPIGPVPVRGRAMGTVLVRNPTFTMTFTHPDLVNAGERYNLDITVTNTSDSPANFVSINLYPRYISGATLLGDPVRSIDSIPPGDSASISYELISQVTGNVFAATLDSDEQIKGKFLLKTSVGELGIPLSPDSLVLPKESQSLPKALRDAAIGMLGKAYATATAPAAALPPDVMRFGKRIVWDRGIEIAEAGFRYSLHEPLPSTASQLLMDFMGSNVSRIPARYPTEGEQESAARDFAGFDDLRRRSVRGDVLAAAVADILKDELTAKGTVPFHRDLSTRLAYRPGFVSVLATGDSGLLPVAISLVDAGGKRVGGIDAKGKVVKEIPYSDFLTFTDASGAVTGQLAMLAAPAAGDLTLQVAVPDLAASGSYTLSVVYPDSTGALQHVRWQGVGSGQLPAFAPAAGDPVRLAIAGDGAPLPLGGSDIIPDLPPSLMSVVQQVQADVFKCDKKDPGRPLGRVVAILFSEEVTPESAQDKVASELITNYSAEANKVVGVALQPGRRIAFVALRDPLGPFIPRTITVNGVIDGRGNAMPAETVPMEATIEAFGGVVSGRILQAEGTSVPGAEIRLVLQTMCPDSEDWIDVGISAKAADMEGRYQWDYVRGGDFRVKEVAIDPNTNDVRRLLFSIARHGQRLNADIVFLGRGTVQGRAFAEDGVTPLKDVKIKVTNLVDQTTYGATTDDDGRYVIPRVPIGNSLFEAVHVATNSHIIQSIYIGTAGAVVDVNVVLLTEEVKKIQVKYGEAAGTVLKPDGMSPVAGVPVIAYYQNLSQPGVQCPCMPCEQGCCIPEECPVAMVTTDTNGAYAFPSVVAGQLRLNSFDQAVYQQGNIFVLLGADEKVKGNILLNGGFGTVRGFVLDADGNPVAGAQVGGGLILATTDATGAYELKDVPLGHAKIVAVSQELGSTGFAEIDIIRNGEMVNATIVLSAIGGVYGTVHLADGSSPAAGIDVFALKRDGEKVMIVGSAVTDAQGRYVIEPLPVMKEDYTISSFLPDVSDGNIVTARVMFNGHRHKADITFKGKGRVEGVIYDDDGQTPLKARVSVSGLTVKRARGPEGKAVGLDFVHTSHIRIIDTDFTTGKFSFDNVFVGQFVITAGGAFSPDLVTFADAITTNGETKQVVMKLQPTSVINGRVFQPDGFTPVGEAVKVIFKSNESKTFCKVNMTTGEESCETIPQGIQEEIVYTQPDGTFQVPIVNAGSFTLIAEDPVTGKTARLKGHVAAGQTAEVKMRLVGKADVTIKVFSSNGTTPILNARVDLEQGDPKVKKNGTAVDGTITFTGIDEGTFVVLAQDLSRGFSGRASGKVVQDGQAVTLNVFVYDATGTVYGTVYRPDGTTAVPNADVAIFNDEGPLAFSVTDGNGQYEQDTIPLGDVRVSVFEASTGRRGAGTGAVDLAGQRVPIIINEAAIGHVRGTVYAAGTMEPLRGWQVRLSVSFPDGSGLSLVATTGTDGTFFFPGIPQGIFTITASRESLGSVTGQGVITRENELVEMPLVANLLKQSLGSIRGIVLNEDGTPASDYSLCIDPYGEGCALRVTAGTDGSFVADELSLGRHTIIASSQVTASRGSAMADIAFAGEAAFAKIIVNGLGTVAPVIEWQNGSPAAGVQVVLDKSPDAGCGSASCVRYADSLGKAVFEAVPPGTYTVSTHDPVTKLSGAATGILYVGDTATPRLVLEVNGTVTGTAVYPDGVKRSGIIVELAGTDGERRSYFTATDVNGIFMLRGIKLGGYTLKIVDPLGSGVGQKSLQVNGLEDLGTIILDDAPPFVKTISPVPGAQKIPLEQQVVITFNEPIQPGSVTPVTVKISDGSSTITGTIVLGDGNTTVTVTPISLLKEQTVYTVQISGITDNLNRPMAKPFVASFTTVDLTPPAVQSLDPAADSSGLPLESVIRIVYNEPVDPAAFSAPAIVVTRNGTTVAGRVDMIFGNTGMVFTPTYPLVENTGYHVEVQPATDLSGNRQETPLSFDFSSLDRKPPVILALTPSNDGTVIEGSTGSVSVDLTGTSDIAFVDFMVNGVIVTTDRSGPFTFNLLAVPSLGSPGDTIKISAVATDTSGNRGTAVDTLFTITPDTSPAVAITAPATGAAFKTGERVNVAVTTADDLGVSLVGYQAVGGVAPAAATAEIIPAAPTVSKAFAFYVPVDAMPGSTIVVNATAIDTKGQNTKATPVSVTVLDATPPAVQFTGTSSGSKVKPGQQVTAVVSASDLGGVSSLEFRVSGGTVYTETRAIDPALASVASSFTFIVSASVGPLDTVNLDVVAVDKAGNRASAAQVVLPVADLKPPQATIRTLSGSTDMVPGQLVTVVVEASDEVGIQRVDLSGTGAFSYANSKGISPPLGSVQAQFTLQIPGTLPDDATLTLQGTATDLTGNVSQPAVLVLKSEALPVVTLPPSLVINAGEIKTLEMQLASPAPASGMVVNVVSANAGIAVATPTVVFAAGEQVKTFSVTGVTGGTTQLRAFIGGVDRGSMTVTVSGGLVTGTVYNPYPTPVAGAEVVVNGYSTVTDAAGRFSFSGIAGPGVSIKAFDPQTQLRGYVWASMNGANGYLKDVQVQLIPAAAIKGTVRKADGITSAGAGVQVEVFRSGDLSTPVDLTFTDLTGAFELPLLQIGSYVLNASTAQGEKGRVTASIIQSGLDVNVLITFLGKGTITGQVVDGAGNPVANPEVRLSSYSLFGSEQRSINGNGDGTFSFSGIFVGDFSLSAKDPVTRMSAGASGKISVNGETVPVTLRLASVASITGNVYRYDGVTPVAGAIVSAGGAVTTTDADGYYLLETLPLGVHTVTADDKAGRSRSKATVSLQVHEELQTQNLAMPGQGSVVVTVTNSDGPVDGASVTLTDGYGSITQKAATDGVTVFDKIQGGAFTLQAVLGTSSVKGSGSTPVGGTTAISLTLPIIHIPAGSITGVAYAPDGKTPLSGVRVTINPAYMTATTDAVGGYIFNNLPLDTYALTFVDETGIARAKASGLVIDEDGETLVHDGIFVGLGSVSGRVLMPDSSSAASMRVSVRSLNRDFGRTATAITDAAGYYLVERLPVGAFTVSAGDAARQLLGETAGTLPSDGDTATADLILQNNAFTPPRSLLDGNLYTYDVQADATLGRGEAGIFTQNGDSGFKGAARVEVMAGSTSIPFAGDPIATQEDQSRELTMRQQNLYGLNLARKVFVPLDGYFARYLEIISNPTAEPVTVDLRVETNFNAGSSTIAVVATSSGDSQLDDMEDSWAVIDDQNAAQPPAVAHVWTGGIGVRQPEVAFAPASGVPANLKATWRGVTVQPGQTVALLHFVVQQTSRDAAQQAAARLIQLPPEALSGLSGDELAVIANFAVPGDGSSQLASLPPLNGEITGQVVAGDGVTPAPLGTPVTFTSEHPLFGRAYQMTTDGSGIFRFVSNLLSATPTVAIPVDAFTLKARVSSGAAFDSPVTPGTFAAGASSTTKNILFSNTGILRGTVEAESTQPLGGVTVRAASGPYVKSSTTPLDGSYRFAFLPPGTYTVTAEKASSQGSAATSTVTAIVTAETETTANLVFPALVTVTGTLKSASGAAVGGASVKLASGPFQRSVLTDGSGKFAFIDVPAGTYSVTGTEPGTGLTATMPVTVTDAGIPSLSLVLPASGRISGAAFFADAATTAAGVSIQVFDAATMTLLKTVTSGTSYDTGLLVSDASGFLVRGTFTYTTHAGNRSVTTERLLGGFGGSNITLTANLTLPVNRTTLLSRLLLEDGSRYLGDTVSVEVRATMDGSLLGTCVTSMASGECSVANLITDSAGVTVRAMGTEGVLVEKGASVSASGGTTTVELSMPVTVATVPMLYHDGSAASYRIAADGRITGGLNGLFDTGSPTTGGNALEIVSAGSGHPFVGGKSFVTKSGGGREIALRQDGLAGLTVIRRIFVPKDGYFVRYVDTLINSGSTPVTVDLSLRSNPAAPGTEPTVILTSSSDVELQPELDRWAVLDDAVQEDPFLATTGNLPATAFIWQGSGAAGASGVSYAAAAGLLATWSNVTIPAGGTAEFLHFVSQQASRSGAQASAARLALLPPEALAGLGSSDLAAFRNFVPPAGGQSTLSPLPPLDGSVSGKVMASDGVTIAPAGTPVSFASASPYFGRAYRTTTDATGAFSFATALDQGTATVGIVRDAYTLDTTVTIGGVTVDASAESSFADGSAVSVRNIFFTIMPSVTTLAPNQIYANQSPITLQLFGSNFTAESEVLLNGQTLVTEYLSATSLRATVPTLTTAGAKAVAVRNPDPLHPGSHVISAAANLTVNLPQFVLTPNPLTIRQKESGTLTLTIPFPATAGGVTAAITSTDPATITAPATVSVPAGQTSVSFTVSAPDTAQTRNVTAAVHANAGNWLGNSTQITVRPEPSVNLSPTTLLSGQGFSFFLVVSLTDPAPAGGLAVGLAASTPNVVSFPASVTVPAGATQFQVTAVNTGTGSTIITATPAAGSGFSAGDACAVTVKPVQTYNIGPTISKSIGVQVGTPTIPPPALIKVTPLLSRPVGITVGPVITGITPDRSAVGTQGQVVRILGTGLGVVTGISFSPADGITVREGTLIAASDGSYADVTIDLAADAPVSPRVVVAKTATGSVKPAAPGATRFLVTYPPPQLLSLVPNNGVVGTSMTLQVNGRYLADASAIAFEPGGGISVGNNLTVSSDGTLVSVPITVDAIAGVGKRVVTITTPGGTTSSAMTVANAFTVMSEAGPYYPNIVAPQVGVFVPSAAPAPVDVRYNPVTSLPVGIAIGPVITGVQPVSGAIGITDLLVRVSGKNLGAVDSIAFHPATGITITAGSLAVATDGSYAEAIITIAADAPLEPRAVILKAGSKVVPPSSPGANLFRVTLPQPLIYGVSPIRSQVGTSFTLTVNGTLLAGATKITFNPPDGITVSNPPTVSADGKVATVALAIAANAPTLPRVVTITTPGGTTTMVPSVANTFTVTADAGVSYTPIVSSSVGVVVATAPLVTTKDVGYGPVLSPAVGVTVTPAPPPGTKVVTFTPIVSPQIGVVVGPIIRTMTPTTLEPGKTVTLIFTGVALGGVTDLKFAPAAGLTVGVISPSADGTVLTAEVIADSAAIRASRVVTPMVGTTSVTAPVPWTNLLYIGARPVVSSITPILQTVGNTFTLTINGTNLDGATTIKFVPAEGIVVANPPVINTAGTQATVTVTIDGMAAGGQRVVIVEGVYGASDGSAGANNTFTVSRPVVEAPASIMMAGEPSSAPREQTVAGFPGGSDLVALVLPTMPAITEWRQEFRAPLPIAQPFDVGEREEGGDVLLDGRDRSVPPMLLAMAPCGYRGPPDWLEA